MQYAMISIEDQRFYEQPRHRLPRHRPCARPDVIGARRSRAARRSPSSSSRSRSRRREADAVREAARGRARLSPDAQMEQAEDPHRVPQLHLLRQRRLRDRIRGPDLLRPTQPRAAARAASPVRRQLRPTRRRCSPASSPRPRLRPGRPPRRGQRGATSCWSRWRTGLHPKGDYATRSTSALPTRDDDPAARARTSEAPYFTTWVRQQIVDRFGAAAAFERRAADQTTLDLDLRRPPSRPSRTTSRAAAARRRRWSRSTTRRARSARWSAAPRLRRAAPFNLATQGQRQPGSAFKPFVLAAGAAQGHRPRTRPGSRARRSSTCPTRDGNENFVVNNFEDTYSDHDAGQRDDALRQLGLRRGRHQGRHPQRRQARRRMGIRTPVSDNIAMTLGGLKQGVTPLDMAHAYETLAPAATAHGLAARARRARSGISRSRTATTRVDRRNKPREKRVLRTSSPSTRDRCSRPSSARHRHRRADGGFAAGKTGTTENYGDAWFVGFNERYTVAVWVGYPDSLKPMKYRLRRRAGHRRHLPGRDLARLRRRGRRDRRRTPSREGRARRQDLHAVRGSSGGGSVGVRRRRLATGRRGRRRRLRGQDRAAPAGPARRRRRHGGDGDTGGATTPAAGGGPATPAAAVAGPGRRRRLERRAPAPAAARQPP